MNAAEIMDSIQKLMSDLDVARAERDAMERERDEARASLESKQVVLDAIGETLQEAGYNLPLQEQVGAVIRDRDEARATKDMHKERCQQAEAKEARMLEKVLIFNDMIERQRSELAAAEARTTELRDRLADVEGERDALRIDLETVRECDGRAQDANLVRFDKIEQRIEALESKEAKP